MLFYNEKLVGFEVIRDSLTCYYTKGNDVISKRYDISKLKNIPIKSKEGFVYSQKSNSYYKHNFYFKDYRFVSYNGGMVILKGEEVLWNNHKVTPFNKYLDSSDRPKPDPRDHRPNHDLSTLAQHPVLSPNENYFLFTSYRYNFLTPSSKLYEIDINTGEMHLISKNAYYYYPSYSADAQYILYVGFSSGQFRIYDRKKKNHLFDYGFQDAFWLTR
jgi:hypothetical protein